MTPRSTTTGSSVRYAVQRCQCETVKLSIAVNLRGTPKEPKLLSMKVLRHVALFLFVFGTGSAVAGPNFLITMTHGDFACVNSVNRASATTDRGDGDAYLWHVRNGVILGGERSKEMTYQPSVAGIPIIIYVNVTKAGNV